jgi:catechol O-methyltransferase
MKSQRTPQNGVLQFHKDTPYQMLDYVMANAIDNDPRSVIKTIDNFCWQYHWMMHVGDEKGNILANIVKETQPKYVLELGTYCGYSTITILLNMDDPNSKVYTIDPNTDIVDNITKKIIEKAGLLNRVVFLPGYSDKVIKNIIGSFDLVFFDHAKDCYYKDLLLLEETQLLSSKCVLVADNVVVFHINDYLDHVKDNKKYDTKLIYTSLEYNSKDANDKQVHEDGIVISKKK